MQVFSLPTEALQTIQIKNAFVDVVYQEGLSTLRTQRWDTSFSLGIRGHILCQNMPKTPKAKKKNYTKKHTRNAANTGGFATQGQNDHDFI